MANKPQLPVFDGSKWDTQFFTTKDALIDRPPTKYFVEPLFAESSLTVVYGLPGEHKTNVVIDAVVCAALGKKWLESDTFEGFKTEKTPILWIDADSGIKTLHERFGASLLAHGKSHLHRLGAKIQYCSFLDPSFMASDDAPMLEIIRRAIALKAGIIVFDNLGTVSGGVDENSSLMIPIMSRFRTIAERTGGAVIVIHHIPKPKNEESRKSPRGHGSIEASLDAAFNVSASDNLIKIVHTKSRHARVSTINALYKFEHKPKTKDLKSAIIVGLESEMPREYVNAREAVIEFFKHNKEANQQTLISEIGKKKVGRNKSIAIIEVFCRCNLLSLKAGQAHNQKVYKLNDAKAKIVVA